MKNSWRHYLRRLATASVVSGSVAWSSAMCYAAQLAFDTPDDPVYADGWQEGDDGGTGFTAWNFDGTSVDLVYNVMDSHEIDDGLKVGSSTSSPFNNLEGKAWTIYNFNGRNGPAGSPNNLPSGATDIARAGRGFAALQPGQTLSVIIDNPIERAFFRGYFINLNGGTGGVNGNICYAGGPCTPGGTPVSKFDVRMFDYFTYGQWAVADGDAPPNDFNFIPLFDTDNPGPPEEVGTDHGVQIDVTLTGADAYELVMTPLDNPGAAHTQTGTFASPGVPIDWIEFTFFNTDSDFYPTMVASDARATDFYIRSIEITDAAPPGLLGDFNEDNTVDAADYVVWRKASDLGLADLPNDNDADGPVSTTEYLLWRENFGEMGGGSGLGSGAVPEPGTFVYLIAGGSAMLGLGLRRGRDSAKIVAD